MEPRDEVLENFLQGVQSMLGPVSGQVRYGNVRQQVFEGGGENAVTNVAIIYESPGGSTNQLNFAFEHQLKRFRALNEDTGEEEFVDDQISLLQRIETLVQSIPEIRMKRLKWDLDRWIDDQKPRAQILATLSKMHQADSGLKGGGVTEEEFKEAARYVAQRFKDKTGAN